MPTPIFNLSLSSSFAKIDPIDFLQPDRKRTLETVFELAEQHLNIPHLLDAEAVLAEEAPVPLLLYISLFRSKLEQMNAKKNPVVTVRAELQQLKKLVLEESYNLSSIKTEFDEECLKLVALANPDEFKAEREYYQRRAEVMDKMLLESRHLNADLEQQNQKLREANTILTEKAKQLEKFYQFESEERKRLQEKKLLQDKIKSVGELLKEEEIAKYLKEAARLEDEIAQNHSKSKELDTTNNPSKHTTKTDQLMWMKNLTSKKNAILPKPHQTPNTKTNSPSENTNNHDISTPNSVDSPKLTRFTKPGVVKRSANGDAFAKKRTHKPKSSQDGSTPPKENVGNTTTE